MPAARLILAAVLFSLPAWVSAAHAARPSREASAHLARTLPVTDSGHLHQVDPDGEYLTEEGQATGTLPGKVVAYLEVGATVVTKFTIYTGAGTLSGEGLGRLKGRPEEPSFAGTMIVSHGTGRYKGAHGRGGFFGALNRVTYKMVVQTTGDLAY